uniref:Uncharacterized protein n=1 Tax=Arundo donax TaxID=35708 RepID=A0A0A9B4S1_ARUDO
MVLVTGDILVSSWSPLWESQKKFCAWLGTRQSGDGEMVSIRERLSLYDSKGTISFVEL